MEDESQPDPQEEGTAFSAIYGEQDILIQIIPEEYMHDSTIVFDEVNDDAYIYADDGQIKIIVINNYNDDTDE